MSAATIGRVSSNNLGLVGHWTFDGSQTNWATGKTTDSSGQNNTGQLINMSTTTSPVAGKVGQALNFNGANYIGAGAVSYPASGVFSYSAWIKPSGSGIRTIISALSGGFPQFRIEGNNFLLLLSSDTAGVGNSSGTVINNQWSHVAVSYDSAGNYKFYINGTLSGSGTNLVSFSNGNIVVGSSGSGGPNEFFNGTIDDVRVYNRTLSANEVKQLYNAGVATIARSNTGTNAPLSSGLVAHWTFDGSATNWGTGQTKDSSELGQIGQLINMSTTSSPVASLVGQAFKFRGPASNECITLSATALKAYLAEDFTITIWVRRQYPVSGVLFNTSWASGAPSSFSSVGASTSISNTVTSVFFKVGTSTGSATHLIRDVRDSWSFFVLKRVAATGQRTILHGRGATLSTLANFVDGTAGTLVFDGDDIMRIGCDGSGTTFNGTFDELRIYNRLLSSSELSLLNSTHLPYRIQ